MAQTIPGGHACIFAVNHTEISIVVEPRRSHPGPHSYPVVSDSLTLHERDKLITCFFCCRRIDRKTWRKMVKSSRPPLLLDNDTVRERVEALVPGYTPENNQLCASVCANCRSRLFATAESQVATSRHPAFSPEELAAFRSRITDAPRSLRKRVRSVSHRDRSPSPAPPVTPVKWVSSPHHRRLRTIIKAKPKYASTPITLETRHKGSKKASSPCSEILRSVVTLAS
jgi:hypothetical protein